MKFKKDELIKLVDGDSTELKLIEDKIIDRSRWSIDYELVFEYDGLLYRTYYSMGATEEQDEGPFEFSPEEIECEMVVKVPVWTYEYKPVTKDKYEDGFGHLMTSKEMEDGINSNCFIDDDGDGRYSDGEYMYEDFTVGSFNPKRSSHVVWFNK
jgi:hypothetical protein